MADTESNSSGFLKWSGGIVASVLTAVLIFYLTRPAPAKPTIEPTALNGFVADSTTHALIRNASVTVALGQNSAHQATDALGRYSVVIASTSPDANMGSVDIQAPGYLAYSNTVALRPGDNFAEITIDAIPPAPPAAAPVPAPAAVAPPPQAAPGAQPGDAAAAPAAAIPLPKAAAFSHAQIILKIPPPNYTKAMTTYAGVAHK